MTSLPTLIEQARRYTLDKTSALSTTDIADTACQLALIVSQAQSALDALKPVLRDSAREQRNEESHVNWTTDTGMVSVTFPGPKYKANKSVDWPRLKADLGSRFGDYFVSRVSYSARKDIGEVIQERMSEGKTASGEPLPTVPTTHSDIARVFESVHRDEPTPRVGFRPFSGAKKGS
jgi:hypothetical protein